MKKSTKGAIAGATAALLLMGGLGTSAAWQGGSAIEGTNIETGELQLEKLDCTGWLFGVLNKVEGTLKNPETLLDTSRLVPGDALTRSCTFECCRTSSDAR